MNEKLVFLVEDGWTKQSGLREKLEKEGLYVSGSPIETALERIEKEAPHVLVIEASPDGKGPAIALLEKLRKNNDLAYCEVFIYSTNVDIPLEKKLRELKIANLFTKDERLQKQLADQINKFFKGWDETHVIDLTAVEEYLGPEYLGLAKARYSGGAQAAAPQSDPELAQGITLLDSGNPEGALPLLEKAASAEHTKDLALLYYGKCLRLLKRYKDAVENLQTGARNAVDQKSKKVYRYELGLTLEEVGKFKEAYQFYSAVYKADRSYLDVEKRLRDTEARLKGA